MSAAVATLSAPGKLLLAGEYAVLEGATAVVAAVDRRVTGRFVPGAAPSTPLVAEAIAAVRAHLDGRGVDLPAGAPAIDSTALAADGRKLGLGSSAAAAVVAVGVELAAAGVEADAGLAFALAARAHRAAQGGRGSGADVAAAVYGGHIAYARRDEDAADVRALAPLPAELVVFATGVPSPTVDYLRAVEALSARDPAAYHTRIADLASTASAFLRAVDGGDAPLLLDAVRFAEAALVALGRDADVPIVTPALAAAGALARELGGAAKPSGAGGGDVGVAFFADRRAAESFSERAPALGVRILSITTGDRGLGRDGQPGKAH
jgi:phosphomevalonate kinase